MIERLVHSELMAMIAYLPPDHSISALMEEDVVDWVDADINEPVTEELSNEAIGQRVISPSTPLKIDSDEEEPMSRSRRPPNQ